MFCDHTLTVTNFRALRCTILYINLVSLSVRQLVEVLKPRSLLIKLSPRTRGLKNYSGSRVFTSYFYVRFRAAIAVVNGGDIFEIWKVGEEIWVRFFWAKGLRGSWFLFFFVVGGRGEGGVLVVLIGGSETKARNVKDRGIDGVHYVPGFTLVHIITKLLTSHGGVHIRRFAILKWQSKSYWI